MNSNNRIAIIGLGYVGLPLAVEFAKKYQVLGFDVNLHRVEELKTGKDYTLEIEPNELQNILQKNDGNSGLSLSNNDHDLRMCNVFIVTVPTPINKFKSPDLTPLIKATEMVGRVLKKGDVVIYESTVYPGCTEEDCVPVLETVSGLKYNKDFFCGYSPERINPGDKVHTLRTIKKVTSGSTPEIAEFVNNLYGSIIEAGTHKASSIKVAEASKAIENAQRDLNISFVNELAFIFDRMGIDTTDVLEAAATKWNFLKFKPGLVGGHCIGVDPYYLAHKAQNLGYNPQVILSGRSVNDSMGAFVANKVVKLMIKKDIAVRGSKLLILGFTFKENCPDIRNTKVIDIYNELLSYEIDITVFDPWADPENVNNVYGINILNKQPDLEQFDVIVLAVAHNQFLTIDYGRCKDQNIVVFDTKACLDRSNVDARL
ncbi:MAG: nucleotide sugar dehydrogenase [Culturomica sp.]|jgi:UDP-N-acetyl-D-galactosamine dehydrogenase|nr:nucleotide sugar dehydrogenase [Culturomica sp.]